MSNSKYSPIHVDLCEQELYKIIEDYLNKKVTSTHSVSHLVKLDDDKWLVRLEYSVVKVYGYAE